MNIVTTMTAAIDAKDVQAILATALSSARHMTIPPEAVSFHVGERMQGFGTMESVTTSLSRAVATATTKSIVPPFGEIETTTSISLDAEQVKATIARHFALDTGQPVSAANVSFRYGTTQSDWMSSGSSCLSSVVVLIGQTNAR